MSAAEAFAGECQCGHSKNSHEYEPGFYDVRGRRGECGHVGCGCSRYAWKRPQVTAHDAAVGAMAGVVREERDGRWTADEIARAALAALTASPDVRAALVAAVERVPDFVGVGMVDAVLAALTPGGATD